MEKGKLYDMVEIAGKTAVSVIPVGGALIAAVWDATKDNCCKKRLEEWKLLIEDKISRLSLTIDEMAQNEFFTSALLIGTEAAVKTMEREKREYLANAVANAAVTDLNESIFTMYISMINQYSLWHILILDFYENPTKFEGVSRFKTSMGSPKLPLFEIYPSFRSNEKIVDKIVKDLYNDGLMATDNLNVTMTGNGMIAPRITEFGRNFLDFIAE